MKRSLYSVLIIVLLTSFALGQDKEALKGKIPPGSKIFIAPMEGNLHPFLAAEIVKKKVPRQAALAKG